MNQDDIPIPGSSEFGLGDTVQSLFFSPKAPTAGGLRYWLTAPDAGPEDWGLRLQFTLLYPR